jgi:molybdate transport system ATP-binding protein
MLEIDIHKEIHKASGAENLNVKAHFPSNSINVLYGPSGCGKTTLLRMIAGLSAPDSGKISFGDQVFYDSVKSINLAPQHRRAGFVFQDFALFPHMSVIENMAYAAVEGTSREQLVELLNELEIDNLRDRKPHTLSGGQKQRLAIARALAGSTGLLLMDEPFSSLDMKLRLKMYELLKRLNAHHKRTLVLVSHDLIEIKHLADNVVAFSEGRVIVSSEPEKMFKELLGEAFFRDYIQLTRNLNS